LAVSGIGLNITQSPIHNFLFKMFHIENHLLGWGELVNLS